MNELEFVLLVNDTLDEMLTESGDEEESDNIVSQVLDEIGIEISGKVCYVVRLQHKVTSGCYIMFLHDIAFQMSGAPLPDSGKIGEKSKGLTDDEIEAQLAKLRAQPVNAY